MADLSITAANVVSHGSKSQKVNAIAGGTITAGLAVRLDSSNQVVAAGNDSAANAEVVGIALNGASADQPVTYQTGGLIDLGATLDVGKIYVLSASGAISPVDDVAAADFVTVLGVATAANRLKIGIIASGVAAAAEVA